MFLSLALIFVFGILGGCLFERFHLPKLIWYLVLGILLGPSLLNVIDPSLSQISSYLRQIALVIILTRSGLSLDVKALKEIGRSAILMCFLPATFEILGIVIFGPLLLNISIEEALLLGSVLAAVSPAVVVPRMIKIKEEGYGNTNHVADLVMVGGSCDDIYVIILFYAFKSLVASSSFDALALLKIPSSIVLGVILGLLLGCLLTFLIKALKLNTPLSIGLMLGVSFLSLYLEELVKPRVSVSSLLAVIVLSLFVAKALPKQKEAIKKSYSSLWSIFEVLLFSLVGVLTDVNYALSKEGGLLLAVIILGLCFRSLGVVLSVLGTNYTKKERIFIIFSYLPKATVQASIGGIALSEGLACGTLVLTAAVVSILVTAPLGALLIDFSYKRLLQKEDLSLLKEPRS